jgi:hypothetical protein
MKIGDKVKIVKIVKDVFNLGGSSFIGKEGVINFIFPENVLTDLKYQVVWKDGGFCYFAKEELEVINT